MMSSRRPASSPSSGPRAVARLAERVAGAAGRRHLEVREGDEVAQAEQLEEHRVAVGTSQRGGELGHGREMGFAVMTALTQESPSG